MPRPSLVTSSGPSPVRGFMAAMLVPLPETTSSSKPTAREGTRGPGMERGLATPASNTLLPSHYPASQDPMTNISRHRLGNAREQNHSIRRCDCDTAPPRGLPPTGNREEFFDAGHMSGPVHGRRSPSCCPSYKDVLTGRT